MTNYKIIYKNNEISDLNKDVIRVLSWNILWTIKSDDIRFKNIVSVVKQIDFDFALFQETPYHLNIYKSLNHNYGIINYSKNQDEHGIDTFAKFIKTNNEDASMLKNSLTIIYNKKEFIPDTTMIFGGYLYDYVEKTDQIYKSGGRGYVGCFFKYINNDLENSVKNNHKSILVINIHQGHGKARNFHLCIKKINSDFKKIFPTFKINNIDRIIIGGDFNNQRILNDKYILLGKKLYNVNKVIVTHTCCVNSKKKNRRFDKKIDYVFDSLLMYKNSRVDYDIDNKTFTNTSDHKPVIYNLRYDSSFINNKIPNYIFNQNGLQEI